MQELKNVLKKVEEKPYDERNMVFILCHGFQGSSYDMMMIQRGIKQKLPNANFLLSLTNEMDTERCIEEMGERLANEVKAHIAKTVDEVDDMILNFVGHSMGGVIARASLKHLTKY